MLVFLSQVNCFHQFHHFCIQKQTAATLFTQISIINMPLQYQLSSIHKISNYGQFLIFLFTSKKMPTFLVELLYILYFDLQFMTVEPTHYYFYSLTSTLLTFGSLSYIQQNAIFKVSQMSFQLQWLVDIINKINLQLHQFLEFEDYKLLCQIQRKTCSLICYVLRLLKNSDKIADDILNALQNCSRLMTILVESTQFRKCGHKLKCFGYILHKFQILSFLKLNSADNQVLLKRLHKNQSSQHYQTLDITPISNSQSNFIKSQKFNCFTHDLSNNQLILQNTQCICCSQVFIKNYPIENKNLFIPMTISLSPKTASDPKVLEQQIGALCNQGGGVILIGADKKQGSIRASGYKFKDQMAVVQKWEDLLAVIHKARPSCRFLFERVMVRPNMMLQEHVSSQYLRFCFRILIFPSQNQKVTFFQFFKKNQKFYQVHLFDEKCHQPKKLASNQIYQKIHQIYYKKKNPTPNSHKNILCARPHQLYSKEFIQYYNNKDEMIEFEEQISFEEQDFDNQCPEQQDQFPVFKFKYQSLLIVASRNYAKRIYLFLQQLNRCQQQYEISRPFHETFKQCVRSVWMISHEIKHAGLKEILKQYMKKDAVPLSQIITYMPIEEVLEIEVSKFTQYHEKSLQRKIFNKFKNKEDTMQKNGIGVVFSKKRSQVYDSKHNQMKKIFYLKFRDKVQSLFAYMYMELANLRPYFIHESNCQSVF